MARITASALVISCMLSAPAFAQWTQAPSFPDGRAWSTALNVGGEIVTLGGTPWANGGDEDASVYSWTPGDPTWIERASFDGVGPFLYQSVGLDAQGRFIVIGGENVVDPEEGPDDPFVYDLVEGPRNNVAPLPAGAPEARIACVTDDLGRLYAIGGGPGAAATTLNPNSGFAARYIASSDLWEVLPPMPTAAADAAAVFDGDDAILVIGGFDASGDARLANVARFDITSGTWSDTVIADLPVALSGCRAVFGADDRLYVLGGESGSVGIGAAIENRVWIYDETADAWSPGPAMPVARKWFAATLGDDDVIYAMGGFGPGGELAQVDAIYTTPCPNVTSLPAAAAPWRGGTLILEAGVTGGTPLTYQWRRDGVDLIDGPAAGGGVVTGAQTTALTITSIDAADDGAYQLVATNDCGTTISAPVVMEVRVPQPFPAAWTFTSLHPSGALSSRVNDISAGVQGGSITYDHPDHGLLEQPTIWFGDPATAQGVTPAGSVGGAINAVGADAALGWWWWPYNCQVSGQWYTCYSRQAAYWSLPDFTHTNLQYSGWEYSTVNDTDGVRHVGTISTDDAVGNIFAHAILWTETLSRIDLHPANVSRSYANAIDGVRQFGYILTPYPAPVSHAAMWSGSAGSFVDLHPAGVGRSSIAAASDDQQVGTAYFGSTPHAGLWHGSAGTFIDLHPPAYTSSSVSDCALGLQVGRIDNFPAVWRGVADDYIDLSPWLPADFTNLTLSGIDVGVDGVVTVVGTAYNTAAERSEAVMLASTVAPACPGDADGSGDVNFDDLNLVLSAWGQTTAPGAGADVTGDGLVNFDDLNLVLGHWEVSCSP